MSCPIPQPLSITLANGTNAERFGVVSNSTPDDCLPFDLTRHTVTTKATNAAGTFVVGFETEVLTPANKGQFKVHFNLADEPMQMGTYRLEVTVRNAEGNPVKTLPGTLTIQRMPL
tara:strand:- start:2116 stop:2463 length:348 start_codon:yes stop_codon:yes gene_type:complete